MIAILLFAVTDPGFPRGSINPKGWGANLVFGQLFPENCRKMKEIGPRGARAPSAPLPSADQSAPLRVIEIFAKNYNKHLNGTDYLFIASRNTLPMEM